MLSPNKQIVLLPQDREIIDITGMSEEQYRWFVRQCILYSKPKPGEPVAFEPITFAITLIVGALLSAASALLAPKQTTDERTPAEESKTEGQDIIRRDRFAPKSGFDSFQNVVDVGSVIPVVYAKREIVDGKQYGGIRLNTNLVFSQLLSVGGGQMFRGIFMVGEGAPDLLFEQTAFGNNILGSYDLGRNLQAGRLTMYYAPSGGRITSNEYILGVIPANDVGNKANNDVYSVEGANNQLGPDFCQTLQPSNQRQFGLYSHIGNNMGYKIGEDFRPRTQWQARSDGEYERQMDNQRLALGQKQSITFTTRAGITGASDTVTSVSVGDVLDYLIDRSSEGDRVFTQSGNAAGGQQPAELNNSDVGSSVSSLQRTYDEDINVGDLYRIGSALAICTERTTDPFVSDFDVTGNGTSVVAKFQVTQSGVINTWTTATLTPSASAEKQGALATQAAQIFKIAIGSFSIERPARVIEVGIKSTVGIKANGLINFNSLKTEEDYDGTLCPDDSYQAYVDAEYCGGQDDGIPQLESYRSEISPGTYSSAENRYSFFRISYRDIDATNYVELSNLYGIRSQTSSAVFNYFRLEFPSPKRRDIRLTPVSGWEIRNNYATGDLYVLDAHTQRQAQVTENGVTVFLTGVQVSRNSATFSVKAFLPNSANSIEQLGRATPDDSDSYVDSYAQLAETFIYSEIASSAEQPEHSISYVNIVNENTVTPEYDDIAILGLNIRSSKELTSLDQLSVYVNEGVIASHNFADVFYDLLTNKRYGVGDIFNPAQIDKASFDSAAEFTRSRKYFFDGAISDKINIRSWGADRAMDFLLDLGVSGGRFTLSPALTFDKPETVVALFTAGNIIQDSFQMIYYETQARTDPKITVRWREERLQNSVTDRGLFPQMREFSLRRTDAKYGDDAPIVQIDLSNFCTNQEHAKDRAKYECQLKHYVTHSVAFKTTPTEANIQVGSIIQLGIETTHFNQPTNGCISSTGHISSWPELANGTYNVLLWDGNTLFETQLPVMNGKTSAFTNAIFSVKETGVSAQAYKVQSIGFDENGNVDVEAIYWPLNNQGVSRLVESFGDEFFTFEGLT
jgi:hypothetical protein